MRIEIEGLSKTYEGGVQALQPLRLEIGDGVFGLVGPNGSGKTTLMRMLATLLAPTEGTARMDGLDIRRDRTGVRRLLGYLPQEFGFYPTLTVTEQLDYMALLCDISRPAERRQAVDGALEQANIADLRDRRMGTLSGGMKQRVGIAQALLSEPKLIIIDEPTSGLDPEERIRMRSLLAELGGDRVIILSTHIVADVAAAADHLAILRFGRLLYAGTPEELLDRIRDRVWLVEADREILASLKGRYATTGVFRTAAGMEVRLLADEVDLPGARRVEPTLEDAYLAVIGEHMQEGG